MTSYTHGTTSTNINIIEHYLTSFRKEKTISGLIRGICDTNCYEIKEGNLFFNDLYNTFY